MSDELPMSNEPVKRDYEVGYGKPPRHTQFQKGQSGNPKGRKPGSVNFKTLLAAAFNERVKITDNGRGKWITKAELAATQIANRAAKGEIRAFVTARDTLEPRGAGAIAREELSAEDTDDIGTDAEQATLNVILAELARKKS